MKNALFLVLVGNLLASCGVSPEQRFAERLAKHEKFCTNAGFKKGSDEYSYCVNSREARHQARKAAIILGDLD